MVHELKILPWYFSAVRDGVKTFEIRKEDDKKFEVGDVLILREVTAKGNYTGRKIRVTVAYCLRQEPYVPSGYVVMSIFGNVVPITDFM